MINYIFVLLPIFYFCFALWTGIFIFLFFWWGGGVRRAIGPEYLHAMETSTSRSKGFGPNVRLLVSWGGLDCVLYSENLDTVRSK